MKINPNLKLRLVLAVGGLALLASEASAGPFVYNSGNLLLGLRKSGSSDLVVNIALGSTLSALPSGNSISIANLTSSQLNGTFSDLNDLTWSVSGTIYPFDTNGFTAKTLWLTRKREDINVQSTPWDRFNGFAQASPAATINALGSSLVGYSSLQAAGTNNTVNGVVIPAGNGSSYTTAIGPSGNWDYQGNVENTTASDFADDVNNVSRVDLYELQPGSGAGTYLGYFDLKADGTLTYTSGPSPVVSGAPVITGIVRAGGINTISFTTASGPTYRLRYTGSGGLSTPVSTWTIGGTTVAGDGLVHSLTDTTSVTNRFYRVEGF